MSVQSDIIKLMEFIPNFLNKWWGILLASLVLMMIVYAPFLFAGKVLYGDPVFFQIPYFSFYKNAINSGESFFWNPYNGGGFPAFASINGFFFPFHYLFLKILSPLAAFNWLIFFGEVFALFFLIIFLLELGIPIFGAWIGGIAFLTSEFLYSPNITANVYSLVFLPVIFWIILKISRSAKPLWLILAGGLATGLAWLSIMPHLVLWTILAAAAFAIFLSIKEKNKKLILFFILINLIGLTIGIFQIGPLFSAAKQSLRGAPLSYEQLSEDAIRPIDLARFFFPDNYSYLPIYRSTDGKTQGTEAVLYAGIIPFLFLAASFFIKFPFLNFFRGLFLVPLLIGLKSSPIFYLLAKIPILNSFRGPSRYMLVGSFAAAILIGFAVKAFLERKSRFLNFKFFQITALPVFLFVLIETIYFGTHWIKITGNVTFGKFLTKVLWVIAAKPLLFLLWLALGLGAIGLFYKNKFGKFILPLIFLVTLGDFIFSFHSQINTWNGLYPVEKLLTIEFLQKSSGRVLSFLPGAYYNKALAEGLTSDTPENQRFYDHATLAPNLNLLYGLESADYYEKLLNYNAARLLSYAGAQVESFDPNALNNLPLSPEEKVKVLGERKALLDFLGIRWIISGYDLQKIGMQLTIPYIYYNATAKPTVYFADKIDGFYADDGTVFKKFSENNFDGFFVKCADCRNGNFSGKGEFNILEEKNNLAKFSAKSASDQFLIFSQNYYRGWQAFIDDKEVPIYKVNTVYMGIFVPAGEHEIKFQYRFNLFKV